MKNGQAILAALIALSVARALLDAAQTRIAPIPQPRSIIVDTDAGQDDLMAIAFLLGSPTVRIEAVCIGTGLAHVPAGAGNVLRLFELAGRRDVPVYLGRVTPLSGAREFPADWRRSSDDLPGVTLPRAQRSPESRPAREFLAERLSDATHPVEVLALGGLTNLAEAFTLNPEATRAIQRLVIMGGAVGVPGNLADGGVQQNTTSEWNIYVDPEAAGRVFASGAPIRLVPLDATRNVPIDAAFERVVQSVAQAPLARAVAQMLATVRDLIDSRSYFAWDPLAAVALVDPSVVRFRPAVVEIRRQWPEEGRTVELRQGRPNAEIATDADAAKFRELFLRALAGGK